MELKTKYQYTYFIYPFVVKENKYQKYLLKLLKDERFYLKEFEKQKNIKMYQYFLPKIGEILFSGFSFSQDRDLPQETASAILAKNPCTIFEYRLKKDVQGKTDENGIFFKIGKIELICFQSGICFLLLKTNIEGSNYFADVLNFNYKFRDLKQTENVLNSYDKIKIQTDAFSDMNKLTEFIEEVTGSKFESMKLDIDTDRFLTYSYVCIDQQAWNDEKPFSNIEYQFIKFSNFLSADDTVSYEDKKNLEFSQWKYAKLGISKQGITLFTSDADMNNYTILPDDFENQYLYTYILNLYKKFYLKKIENDFQNINKIKKARREFIDFTKKVWIQEITEDEAGSYFNYNITKVLDLDRFYMEIRNQYDILYKEYNIEKNHKTLRYIFISMVILIIVTVLNYIALIN
mgnify:FL=1